MSAEVDDLEALFDQVAAATAAKHSVEEGPAPAPAAAVAAAAAPEEAAPEDMFHRIGHLTRSLHDALHELGYDKMVENAVASLPDARDRLDYIATLTGQAAEKVLGAVEHAREEQDRIGARVAALRPKWDAAFAGTLSVDEFRGLAEATRTDLAGIAADAGATSGRLTDIMMAQDFHDLTGQVIQRVVALARTMEHQLVQILLETSCPDKRTPGEEAWLTGPAMNAASRSDVVANQQQVDDLLESLGF
jgi:chemotaxis protein CheZ